MSIGKLNRLPHLDSTLNEWCSVPGTLGGVCNTFWVCIGDTRICGQRSEKDESS